MTTRIGVDIGGTFTDLLFYNDADKTVTACKVPTTPHSPDDGCINAVRQAVPLEQSTGPDKFFMHGTTVGLNALLQRKGAVVGLLATEGFRDVLELRRGDRSYQNLLFWQRPEPLVPRHHRLPVRGRIFTDGDVYKPLVPEDVTAALDLFKREGVTSIAVAFMNSYTNPEHELEAERLLRSAGFEGGISLSHRVSGEYREYERTTTTVVDAFVRGVITEYFRRLEAKLRHRGFEGTMLITRSGGGSMTFDEASERPFETIMSGPVAGVAGTAELAKKLNLKGVVSADVGGTSFDTSLVIDGRPELLYEGEIVGMPLQIPWVDVRSIGAGGGSIAYMDRGLLRVGPESAGAVPGPACYGNGGTRATTTDAAFYLGMLGTGVFESGLTLKRELATRALQNLAEEAGISVDETAQGIMRISTSAMADAVREITVERGIDPTGLVLMSFGGAGPLWSCLLSLDLEISRIIVPPYAGAFSAWGLLGADPTSTRAKTRILPLDENGILTANAIAQELFVDLSGHHGRQSSGELAIRKEVAVDMRFLGQEHSLTITVPSENGVISAAPGEILELFCDKYREAFGGVLDVPTQIVSVRATVIQPLPSRDDAVNAQGGTPLGRSTCKAYSFTRGEYMTFAVIAQGGIDTGETVQGPAIINELTSTTYLDAGFRLEMDASGCMYIYKN